jgi:hypothetical protein
MSCSTDARTLGAAIGRLADKAVVKGLQFVEALL